MTAVVDLQNGRSDPPDLFVATDLGEDLLATIYLLLKDQGLLDWVFFQNTPSLREFLGWGTRPDSRFVGCFLRPTLDREEGAERSQSNRPGTALTEQAESRASGGPQIGGLGWLWNIGGVPGGMHAEAGMVFLRQYWRSQFTDAWTRQLLDYSFGTVKLDVLTGSCLSDNPLAIEFVRRLGFTVLPPIPKISHRHGVPANVVMSYLTREQWESRR